MAVTRADDLDSASYVRMRWNAPLSEEHAALLVDRLQIGPDAFVLDLGCGWGELLLRAVAAGGSAGGIVATGVGVDTDSDALARARILAEDRRMALQVRFVHGAAEAWNDQADRIICIGAAHAWGGTAKALTALGELLRPGGRLLYGDACWEQIPSDAAAQRFGSEVVPISDVIRHATQAGWRVLHLSTANLLEWDDFESTWRAGRQEWLLRNADDERADAVRNRLDTQLEEYVSIYRGLLGFCFLVLGR